MNNTGLFAKLEARNGYEKTNKKAVLNQYVNFHKHANTQTLADVLVAESIQMRGVEAYYIKREYVKPDMLFGEDLQNKFTQAYKIAIYINTFDSYEGQREIFSKFQMTVNDEMTFSVNPNLFEHQTDGHKPKEGDLLYFPMDNSLFELIWVEPRDPFYQVGQNAIRKITAQKFIYSGEEIKPELQKTELDIDFDVSDLELEPVRNLDSLADISTEQFVERNENHEEAAQFVEDFVVVNGRGTNYEFDEPKDPVIEGFDDF